MRPHVLCALIACSLSTPSVAQSQLEWLRTHNGPPSMADYCQACAIDASGNVYVAGRSYAQAGGFPPPPPQADFELVKYSPAGLAMWSARTDAYGYEDVPLDFQLSPSGDAYICGYSFNGTDYDRVLLAYSSSGVLQWIKKSLNVGGSDSWHGIAFDASGNVIVGGNAYSATSSTDVLIESYTPAGVLNWSTLFDGGANGFDIALALSVLPSGEILVGGQVSHAITSGDFAVWKLSSTGSVSWGTTLDGGANGLDMCGTVVPGVPGKVLAGGYQTSGSINWMVAQLDLATGNVDWSATHDGSTHAIDAVRSIAVDAQGVAWVCGLVNNTGTGVDFLTKRFDATGALLSSATWSHSNANYEDSPMKVLLGGAGQAWVCGYTTLASGSSDAAIVQYDSSGAFDWAGTYSTPGAFDDRPFDMEFAPGNRIALAGYTNGGGTGNYDYLALQVDLSDSPQAYCTSKTTANGCVPRVSFTGMPSASATGGFTVRATQLRNQKSCLLFYGLNGAAATPFQGGTMCVQAPVVRTLLQNSGGTALPADDCSGTVALDMNAFASGALGGNPAQALSVAGTAVYCQFWGRDPGFAPPQNTMLSSALRYVVLP